MTITINGTTGIAGVDGSAATPSVQGGDTNTGVFFPAADQVALSASGSQVVLVNASGSTITGTQSVSGNLSFNSGYGSAATAYGCRAWVNFDGTTNTAGLCTIRGSGNVTSVADNGVGLYTINLTTAMPDDNYALVFGVGQSQAGNNGTTAANILTQTTTAISMSNGDTSANSYFDNAIICASIFR